MITMKKTIKVYMNEDLLKKLKLKAIKFEISFSALVEKAVEEWIFRNPDTTKGDGIITVSLEESTNPIKGSAKDAPFLKSKLIPQEPLVIGCGPLNCNHKPKTNSRLSSD